MGIESRIAKLERAAGDLGVCQCATAPGVSGYRTVYGPGGGTDHDSDLVERCVVCGRERVVFEVVYGDQQIAETLAELATAAPDFAAQLVRDAQQVNAANQVIKGADGK